MKGSIGYQSEREIMKAISGIRESGLGEDGVIISYIKLAREEMKAVMVELIQLIFQRRAHEWSEGLKSGIIVPLFKKGDRKDTIIGKYAYSRWAGGFWLEYYPKE